MASGHVPYNVAFPVDFATEGDTTRNAFRKHMDEIIRVYGILTWIDLNTLDADAVSNMLKKHTPNMSFDDISGEVVRARINGELTAATIDGSKVTGLSNMGKLGIVGFAPTEKGYIAFYNGGSNSVVIQWGRGETVIGWPTGNTPNPKLTTAMSVNFGWIFGSACYSVVPILCVEESGDIGSRCINLQVENVSKNGFKYRLYSETMGEGFNGKYHVKYIAIGNGK